MCVRAYTHLQTLQKKTTPDPSRRRILAALGARGFSKLLHLYYYYCCYVRVAAVAAAVIGRIAVLQLSLLLYTYIYIYTHMSVIIRVYMRA
jgi:hypothetical protein